MAKITLRLSEEARRGWEQASLANGVTMTAFIEASGRALAEHGVKSPFAQEVIDLARQIDVERRTRRRR